MVWEERPPRQVEPGNQVRAALNRDLGQVGQCPVPQFPCRQDKGVRNT